MLSKCYTYRAKSAPKSIPILNKNKGRAMGHLKQLVLTSTLLAITSTTLSAAENEAMIASIMKLRGEVEGLYTQIDANKESYKSQMKSFAVQIADNESQVNRKETATKVANAEAQKLQEQVMQKGAITSDLKPMLTVAIDNLETVIKNGMPFKTSERVAELQKIKTDLASNSITQEKALSLVWASYDDTLRMTKEIGMFKQLIEVNNEQKMAKVAKIGTAMMFFMTPDEEIGYVKNDGGAYSFVLAEDETSKEQIVALFDALQKQIRTGYFSLPNALIVAGAK
jgi:predicted lipase